MNEYSFFVEYESAEFTISIIKIPVKTASQMYK